MFGPKKIFSAVMTEEPIVKRLWLDYTGGDDEDEDENKIKKGPKLPGDAPDGEDVDEEDDTEDEDEKDEDEDDDGDDDSDSDDAS
ncbi:MAG: hypothetical protein AAB638_00015 [Patescibacteria group bacterium]